jgi:putative oxidoreductase
MMLHKLMHNPVMAYLRKPSHADCAKLLLRLAVGAVFINHGWMKLQDLEMTETFFGSIGVPMAGLMAPFVGLVEFGGGIALLLGLGVRLVGFLHASTMVVAILTAFGLSRIADAEIEYTLLAASLSLMLTGAGAYSLDALIMKRLSKEHDAAMPMMPPKA